MQELRTIIEKETPLVKLMTDLNLVETQASAKRLIHNQAVMLNGRFIEDVNYTLSENLRGDYIILIVNKHVNKVFFE